MDYTTLNWVLMIATFAVMIGVGAMSSRTVSESDEGGFLLAGRSLGPFVGASTIVATGFSGWGFMGSPGVAYEFGAIEVLGNFFFAPAMMIAVLFFANSMQKRALKMGSNTIPEYIAQIHGGGAGGRLLQGVAAAITIVLLMVFMVSQIKAVGMLGASWLGIDMTTSAWMMISIIIIYTMWGGLAAVAWTDTIMVCGMVLGALVITGQMFFSVDLSDWVTRLNDINPSLLNPETAAPYGDSKVSVFFVLPYAFLFAAVLPYMAVRFLAFRPDVKMHRVGVYVALMGGVLSLIPIVGLYMRAYGPALAEADQAMPMYLDTFMHPAVQGIITLFIIFAMKSTANSMLHTVASATSHDTRVARYQPLLDDPDCPIDTAELTLDDLLVEPVYQLMRQALLAHRMEATHELDAEIVRVVYVAPVANHELWASPGSPAIQPACTSPSRRPRRSGKPSP